MLKITQEHQYFSDQAFNNLFEWKPTNITRQWLQKMPLHCKLKPNEIHIIPDEDELHRLTYFLQKIEGIRLSFELYSKKDDWFSCSELPVDFLPQNHVLYFSNRYPVEQFQGFLHQ